jgi:predicted amidohydrolase
MKIRPKAVSVRPCEGYRLYLVFDNGEERIYDAAPKIWGKTWGRLKDFSQFSKVYVDGYSVAWDDGLDICPDDLYYNSVLVRKAVSV